MKHLIPNKTTIGRPVTDQETSKSNSSQRPKTKRMVSLF